MAVCLFCSIIVGGTAKYRKYKNLIFKRLKKIFIKLYFQLFYINIFFYLYKTQYIYNLYKHGIISNSDDKFDSGV